MKDYGETPVKRARLALEGYTWGCPTLPTAADLAGMNDVMVAAEATMSQQAADLAPGTHVEYRSREPYLIGGWFRAKVLQVNFASIMSASMGYAMPWVMPGQFCFAWCCLVLYPCCMPIAWKRRPVIFVSLHIRRYQPVCTDAVCHR